ncbi:MAG: hypothetical protein M1812_002421 [Candelaria pacifica]|nr:MAG: hypothetical protein M1812_002421 [Candelaria pacifica]
MDITQYFKPLSATIFPSKPLPSTPSKPSKPPIKTPQPLNPPPPSSYIKNPHPKPTQRPTLPPELTLEPPTLTHIASLKRINALLLPIRYPDKFYTEILSSPETAHLTRVALWQSSSTTKRKHHPTGTTYTNDSKPKPIVNQVSTSSLAESERKVIGSIRCRLEYIPTTSTYPALKEIYIQTLTLLSPYRGLGIGSALLEAIIYEAVTRYGATSLYAHVWEKNLDALDWYSKRGFEVGEMVEGYYRRLKPGGARVVRRRFGAGEVLRIVRGDVAMDGEKERGGVDGKESGERDGD